MPTLPTLCITGKLEYTVTQKPYTTVIMTLIPITGIEVPNTVTFLTNLNKLKVSLQTAELPTLHPR